MRHRGRGDGFGTRTVLALALTAGLTLPTGLEAQDRSVYYIGGAALVAVLPGFLFDLPQPDEDRSMFKLSAGRFDAVDHENEAVDFWIEYQPGLTWHRIKPLFGGAINSDGSYYAWAGGAHDFHMGPLVVNLNMGPALYIPGAAGKELGSHGVLRSGFEVGYRFGEHARLTASYHHMSHGKLMNPQSNPGTEVISLNVTVSPN